MRTNYRAVLTWFDYKDGERSETSWDRCHINVLVPCDHDIVLALQTARGKASVMSRKLTNGRVWEVTGIHEV